MPKAKQPPLQQVVDDLDQALKNMPTGSAICVVREKHDMRVWIENDDGHQIGSHTSVSIEDCLRGLRFHHTATEFVFKGDES
jgi:hypothetical protein